MQIDIAVVPVAGRGTRLLPATKSQPKEMLPVGRQPVVALKDRDRLLGSLDEEEGVAEAVHGAFLHAVLSHPGHRLVGPAGIEKSQMGLVAVLT